MRANELLCLASVCCCLVIVVAGAAQETSPTSDDLDNSIGQTEVGLATATPSEVRREDKDEDERRGKQEKNNKLDVKDKQSTAEDNNRRPEESNDLREEPSGQQQLPHHHDHQLRLQLERQEANARLLSGRLDLLEFELRKTILLLHHQMRINSANHHQAQTADTAASPTGNKQDAPHNETELVALADLSSRLELMEKFITVTTKKLYETEQRVKQLERCDCRLKCKWLPATEVPADQQQTPLVKMDGQVWRHKCDVCSCHRGHVRCRHVDCPKADCPEPSYVPGRCCPVCHKNCLFNGQTVGHGHKLVINSKQNTCKECLCSDGRLKCHRVEQLELWANSTSANNIDGQLVTAQLSAVDDYPANSLSPSSAGRARIQRSTPIDLGLDFSLASTSSSLAADDPTGDKFDEQKHRRRSGRWTARTEQLVCPQIDCKLEEQIRLKNDCCTYCRGFDFCSLHSARANCHPDSTCVPSNVSSALAAVAGGELPPLSSMFECRCRAGFSGNGRFCRDIDECADKKLNDCDQRTSSCVNSAGSYQCKCRPGYTADADSLLPVTPAPTAGQSWAATREASTQSKQRACRDINECSDGKLNRCHEQAKCMNLNGAYKCHCKRGYLGNGFECHQWFSSQPGVAAYLHRHSSSASASASPPPGDPSLATTVANKTISRAAVSVPLSSLFDPDEDRSDLSRADLDSLEYRYDDDDDDNGNSPDSDDNSDGLAADLADSRWEPLRLSPAGEQSSQQAADSSQADNTLNGHQQQATTTTTEPAPLVSSSLNTRTMFFQPPPRFRRPPPQPDSASSQTTTANPIIAPATTSSTDPAATATATSTAPTSDTTSGRRQEPTKQEQQQPPRRGSIIASASFSPNRAAASFSSASSHNNGLNGQYYHQASKLQHRNLFHQQQKALRVSSSPSSAAVSSIAGTINFPTSFDLLAAAAGTTQSATFLNLVLLLIATILQLLN